MAAATIQKITEILPIPNADSLELAKVLGWQCVVKKGEFHPGQRIVFVEVDSIVPEKPEFEFLRKYHFRIRSMKLRGCLSQGLILTIPGFAPMNYEIGQDVSEEFGITHYEKPIPAQMRGFTRSNFPTHLVSMTDETRLQSVPEVIDEMINCHSPWIITVKMDGTSATYVRKDNDYHVCSRKLSLKINEDNKDNLYLQMYYKYGIDKCLENVGNYAIQGEICGPGIQKNRMEFKENKLLVFNVFDVDNQEYLDYSRMIIFCQDWNLEYVPLIQYPHFLPATMDEFIQLAEGLYEGTNTQREGIVIRPAVEKYSPTLKGRLSFKVINNLYKED